MSRRRELEASPAPVSVVNTEHAHPPNLTHSSIRVVVTNTNEDPPSHNNGDQPMMPLLATSPMTSVPMPTLPSHINVDFRWRAYSLPLLTETTGAINYMNQQRQNQHHLSLAVRTKESRLDTEQDYQQIDEVNAASVSSPELHYYHVLERPEYYNCIWLEGENGHELLLGQSKRSSRQRVTIKEDDSESDSEYHWKVVLTSSAGPGQDLDLNTSSKKLGRHLYRRLDQSTMEPHQDYAKVSIASSSMEHHCNSNGDSEESSYMKYSQ